MCASEGFTCNFKLCKPSEVYVLGIIGSLWVYGVQQERIMSVPYGDDMFKTSVLLVCTWGMETFRWLDSASRSSSTYIRVGPKLSYLESHIPKP